MPLTGTDSPVRADRSTAHPNSAYRRTLLLCPPASTRRGLALGARCGVWPRRRSTGTSRRRTPGRPRIERFRNGGAQSDPSRPSPHNPRCLGPPHPRWFGGGCSGRAAEARQAMSRRRRETPSCSKPAKLAASTSQVCGRQRRGRDHHPDRGVGRSTRPWTATYWS